MWYNIVVFPLRKPGGVMINYIVCDDNKKILDSVRNVIDKVMMKNDTEYEIHAFNDYNQDFKDIIKKELPNKIYILDIETPSASGIDIARKIRSIDYRSIIIFLTAHEELGHTLLQKEYLFLAFINKYDNYQIKLVSSIRIALKNLNCSEMLRYQNNGVYYNIPLDDIIYIYRDSVERKCLIKTGYAEILISKQLNEIKEDLNDNFVYSHRSCIVNKARVRIVDMHNKRIIFDNDESVNLVSSLYKKEANKNDV